MDVTFMEEYYRQNYEDFVTENIFIDEQYQELRLKAYKDIEELEERLKPISPELIDLVNRTLDALSDKEAYLIEKSYLQGASDRERMLK